MLRLGETPDKGRGVFATRDIQPGETLEDAPVLVLEGHEADLLKRTQLFNYFFVWSEAQCQVAVCFGFGSIYNHSRNPNAEFVRIYSQKVIRFRALRKIRKGDEICTDYHSGANNRQVYAFEERRQAALSQS
jgi:uncharacterized protein